MTKKHKISNRILSLVLALVMVLGMMPMMSLTAHATTYNDGVYVLEVTDYKTYWDYNGAEKNSLEVVGTTDVTISVDANNRIVCSFKVQFYNDIGQLRTSSHLFSFTVENKSCTEAISHAFTASYDTSDAYNRKVTGTLTRAARTEHTGGQNTCVAGAVCSICGTQYGSVDSDVHNWGEWTTENGTHSRICTLDDSHTESGTCSGGTATCDSAPICTTCGKEYGSKLGHSYQYSANGNVITETCKNNCGHSETATLTLDTSVSLNYTGSEIKPLKVEYSDGWQGRTLDIAYQNNTAVSTDVSKASGSITKNDATVTLSFTITKATMSGISVNGYSGVYDGEEHGISITNVPADATVTYSTSENGIYTSTNPTYKDKGSYTLWYKIEKENYEIVSGSADVVISPAKLTVKADDISKTYGESDPTLTWQITEGRLAGADALQNISISRVDGKDADSYAITVSQTEGSNPNYDITFEGGTFTINQKEIGITWGATEFLPYTGELIVPQATATGLESGDVCTLTTSVVETTEGAGIIPGRWHAKVTSLSNDNYCLPKSGNLVEIEYEIVKGYIDAPVVSGIGETIKGKADGKINGLTTEMEYATEYTADDDKYTKVTDANMTFAAGTYYVRYQAAGYYNASPFTEVTIKDGGLLNVSVPATQTGYTLTVADTKLVWNGSTTITFALADGYSKTNDFAVKVNGDKVELDADGKYVITNAQENITVTVEGVADTTAPTAEITLGTNKWNTFLNNITFGLFFKETQSVTIIAEDANTGSGLDKVYYYLASEELTEDEVKALADWKEYDGAFSINPNKEYIIYVKAADKAGNVAYISSDGIVLDAIAPVITGIENNGAYYGNTEFGVDESYIDTVTVDGNKVELTDGKYTITADGKEHTIVVTDKAGNNATVKVKVVMVNSWTTTPSISDWTYGETAKTPNGAAKHGEVKVEYRLASETDADYTTTVPTEAGSYLVRFSVEGTESYTSLSEVVNLEIAKAKLTVTADDKSKTYGENDPALTWKITDGKLVGTDELKNIFISRTDGKDADSYAITVNQTEGANPNYDITFKGGTFTINQKEVDISWGATMFLPYTGSSLVPKANVTNLEAGDECILTTEVVETADGAGIIPGTWTAKVTALSNDNYKLPESGECVTATFEIVNASQNYAPDGVSGVNETIDGKADGKIAGVDSTMEYRKDGETEYTAINGTEVTDLADGTYYVRYAAKTYYNASPDKEVVIGAGRKLTVTVPTTQTGYTITAEDTEIVWNGSTTITFALANGYSATEAFAVKINGNEVELNDNQYVITNAQENITVTVEGVADTTAPTAEITLGTNKWNTFLNNITFGLFFKDTQSVTVSAEDVNTGSGLDKVYYYLATEELTEDEVKALADWKEYDGAFSINPNKEYIIYAKAVDKAGNAAYISSEGIVLDAIVPVIIGVENDGTYYGNTQFSVDESYIDTVIVDENNVDLTDGKYTITADGKEHTIVVTDKAGNSATVKVTVITIASLDDTIENIKTTDVKSTDKEDIQKVLDFVNSLIDSGKDFTDEEDEQLSEIKSNAESLLKQIDDTKAETKDLTDKVNAYEEAKVTSDDKQTLTDLVTDIDELLEGDNLTEEEKEPLEEVKETAEALIKKIDDIAAETKDLTDKVDAYDETKVTSDDKQTIEDLIADIDELLEGDNLTEEEKEALGDVKDDAEALIKKIDDAAKADDTDNTEKVKDITSDNVTTDDKVDLEKAKDDLEKALEDYKDNLTEDEKKAIEDEIDRIDDALEIIEKVEAVEDKINKLPDTITKNDADAIKDAKDAYNALSKYEQSIVDKDIKKKLDNAIAALENLNKPVTSPDTGDNTNIWMWFAVLFVSGMGLFGTIVYDRKKKQAK